MQIKWLEDLIALSETRSFVRAAAQRHVTHPAFGRRIKSLEAWAGVELVLRDAGPVTLTAAGETLLQHARQAVEALAFARSEIQDDAVPGQGVVTLATGRTLARTLAADWLWRMRSHTAAARVQVRTGSMAETLQRFERGEADFMLTYYHPAVTQRLQPSLYLQHTMAHDRLVPVSRAQAGGKTLFRFSASKPVPYLAYANTLALGQLVSDHLSNHAQAPRLKPVLQCDSADALLEYVLKGLGVAWLPWSLAVGAHREGKLAPLAGKALEIAFEVRMVRTKRRLSPLAESLWDASTAQ
ncbi:LysR family transcriptional regulator [Hydrogenophaga sp. BPS33]|uniref:LysR family transcriptional regulator n=1 Tax=Hydrogenophaga sp. BPS33 TaxID=2651974 RepID=UPI0013204879|nr:LysR family transcriptional regulator [Hydrogenophaga sp. BPS33]QHE88170.1 LysR family transcriptional regulator [Hydrogenophaga sp. BPS33]